MKSDSFSSPQRQAPIGILLVFFTTLYKAIRTFWVLGAYLIIKGPGETLLVYIVIGLVVFLLLSLIYSYWYYRKFLFHIDYTKEEFVLQKGVFSSKDIAIPFDRIQQVYFRRSVMQRLVNVYSIVVETAGSKEEEISIMAISKHKADELLSILIKEKDQSSAVEPGTGLETPGDLPKPKNKCIHKLSLIDLLKIGISTNYLRGFVLIVAFFSTLYNEVNRLFEDYTEGLSERFEEIPGPSESIGFFLLVIIAVLFMSIVITVIEVFIKYFNLKLNQGRESLELEMGLKTNTKVSLQPRRVQLVQIVTNPVQKWLNLFEARIFLAGSENNLQKSKIKIPGLNRATVKKIKSFLYDQDSNDLQETFRPHSLLFFRKLFIALIPLILSLLVLLYTPYISLKLWFILAGVYAFTAIFYHFMLFKSIKWEIHKEFLRIKSGVWNQYEEIVEIYKIQAISVKEPLWYRKRNLINVTFHTAGGDIPFRAVDKNILSYINYMLFRVESSHKGWM